MDKLNYRWILATVYFIIAILSLIFAMISFKDADNLVLIYLPIKTDLLDASLLQVLWGGLFFFLVRACFALWFALGLFRQVEILTREVNQR